MKINYACFTHKGYVRKTNQDNFFIPDDPSSHSHFFMVADGMGGHNAGDVASKMAVDTVVKYMHENSSGNSTACTKKMIFESIKIANKSIIDLSMTHEKFSEMGTTITVTCINEEKAFVGHVGDSRAYIVKKGLVKQITRDHSLVQELFDNGLISLEEMSHHPNRNVLTRALGVSDSIEIDFYEEELEQGDLLLLCTDGLNLYVDPEKHTELFNSGNSLDNVVNYLGQKALAAGGADNVTIVAAQCISPAE